MKLRSRSFITLFYLLVVALGNLPGQNLEVVSVSPLPNSNHVSRSSTIQITFDQMLDADSLIDAHVIVHGSMTQKISGTISGGGTNVLVFTPNSEYRIGEAISVTLTTGVSSQSGETLIRGHTYSFNVISGTPPSSPVAFAQRNIGSTRSSSATAEEAKVLDFDGDGDLDVITGASGFTDISLLYENDGNQNFCKNNLAEWRYVDLHDIDGDGDLDAFGASGGFNQSTSWYENEGSFPFTERTISSADPWHLTGGDMDSDGDIDLLVATLLPNELYMMLNDGSAGFATQINISSSFDGGNETFLEVVDMNGDGAQDILAFYEDARLLVWFENDGDQNFTEQVIDTLVNRQLFDYGDIDDDGDLDIVIGVTQHGDPSPVNWYENDGDENFTLHIIPFSATNPPEDISLTDLDGDLDIDILAGSYWLENDGDENFTQYLFSDGLILGSYPYIKSITFGDLENDGDMDAITLGLYSLSWQENSLFMEITSTSPANAMDDVAASANVIVVFSETIDDATLNNTTFSVRNQYGQKVSGTLSGGGTNTITFTPDVDFRADERVEVSISDCLLSTTGHSLAKKYGFEFVVAPGTSGVVDFDSHPAIIKYNSSTSGISGMAISDIDLDGDLDIVSSSYTDMVWHVNDGNGNFTNDTIPITIAPINLTILDVNDDGHMDIVVQSSSSIKQYLNDGNQSFIESDFVRFAGLARDFDHDGDADFVDANSWDSYLDHCDDYDLFRYRTTSTDRLTISVGDLDGDGDLDLLRAGSTGTILDTNFGFENFLLRDTLNEVWSTHQDLADLDSDGDLDYLVVERFIGIAWFENRFSDGSNDAGPRQVVGDLSMDPRGVRAADFDGDGDPDIVAISRNDDKVVWYENRLNEVSADFGPETAVGFTADGPVKVLTADMDGDGDIDIVTISDIDDELNWFENLMVGGCPTPIITSHPIDQTVNEGEDVTFTVSATGDELSYQWQLDGVDISGATSNVLVLTSVALSDAGSYQCIVSNSCGDLPSDAVDLIVNELTVSFTVTNTTDGEAVTHQQTTPVSFSPSGADKVFQLTNTGDATLTISSISSSDGAFEVSNVPGSVDAGSTASFTVTFSAIQTGQYQGIITITSNTDVFSFSVAGEAMEASTSFELQNTTDNELVTSGQNAAISFGQITSDAAKTFEISNTGETDITISNIVSSDGAFVISDIPGSIAVGASASFTVTLSSADIGFFTSTITISSSLEDFVFDVQGEVIEAQSLIVYNAVAPDGDGKHDFFKIENIDHFADNSVQIFNRWGKKVFEAEGYDNTSRRFDGKSNVNGTADLSEGTYYYIIETPSERLSGHLFLRR